MTGSFVQDRREIKYLVSLEQVEQLMRRLGDVLTPDAHDQGRGYINHSIYFDSPQMTFYREKIEGLATRMKPRLRSYRSLRNGPPEAIFLEFKHRDQHFVSKQRVALAENQAARLLDGDAVLDSMDATDCPVMNKFAALARRMDLHPVVGVRYHRTAYGCTIQPGLRITIDRRMECTEVCTLSPAPEAFVPIEAPTRAVIEIKYNVAVPGWLLDATAAMELEHVSFSKYANSVERTRAQRRTATP